MRILITGSGGRLGRLLYAAKKGRSDNSVEVLFQSRGSGRDVQWSPGDPFSTLPRCDAVIALWGGTSGTPADLALNVELTSLSQQIAENCGARRIFHLSSAAVYGPGVNMDEETPLRPQNAYGASKRDMERAVGATTDDLVQTSLRLANVVGADSLAAVLNSDADVYLDRFADARGPLRSYIGAIDLLSVFCGLSTLNAHALPRVLNIAAPHPLPMEALALAAGKKVIWRPAPTDAVHEVSLNVKHMLELLPAIRPSSDAETLVADLRMLEART